MSIRNILIRWLGGITPDQQEHRDAFHMAAIERLNNQLSTIEEHRVTCPIHTIRATYIVQDEHDMDVEMKIARQATYDKIRDVLRENDFVDFKINYDSTIHQYKIVGTLTIVEK